MFAGCYFKKGSFKELQFLLKQVTATYFICIFKWHIAIIFPFNETNNENAFPDKLLEIIKGPSFHCQKFLDLKSL